MDGKTTDQAAPASIDPGPSFVRIPLRDRAGSLRDYALVDDADAHLAEHRWFINSSGYAARQEPTPRGGQRTVLMARVVMGLVHGDSREADHISRDKLDNRRSNLRIATHAQNAQNRVRRGGLSKHRGVSFRKDRKSRPWVAYGTLNGKTKWLGFFDEEEQAAAAAVAWRREHLPFAID
jgi:hypothetical protein